MAQSNEKYTQELSNGIISSNQAEVLVELRTLLANLEEVYHTQQKHGRFQTDLYSQTVDTLPV